MTYVDPLRDPEPLLRRVYAYVAYRIGDGPEAEDVVSAAVERALRYRASYRPELGEPIAWLLGIAKRSLRDHYAQREREDVELRDVADATDVESDTVERVTLQHAVARLSERERELLALRYGADLTAKQIAKLVDAKTNAVEVALHRALARLRAELEPGDATAAPPAVLERRAAESL